MRPGTLFLIVILAGAVPVAAENALPASVTPLRQAEKLSVNASNEARFVVSGTCESEGMGQVRELMLRSEFEELWAFIPATPDSPCRWVELGMETRAGVDHTRVQVDWRYLDELMRRYRALALYHFHPLVYFERCQPGPGCSGSSVPLQTGVVPMDALVANLQFAMPSAEDIYFMSESAWRLDRHHPGRGIMRHRMISPYGVIEYSLTEAGKKRYAENRGSRMEGLYIKLVAANSLADDHILETIGNHPLDMQSTLANLVSSMNSPNLRVRLIQAE